MGSVRFGVQICWENLFPDQFRELAGKGVDFMVSMTNEQFTDSRPAHYQMLSMNVFRAIENGISIVRTAPSGVSALIGPSGRIIGRLTGKGGSDISEEGFIVGEIPLSRQRTFYTRHGDWFVALMTAISVVAFIWSLRGIFIKIKLQGEKE
jgi:apolipoprotein N-acyltransferase